MLDFSFLFEALVLTIALSTDTLASGFAYGTNKIKIPWLSAVVISLICSLILAISLFLGKLIGSFISSDITLVIGCLILIFLGIIKIMDSYIKNIIKKNRGINKNLEFSLFNVRLTLNLYAKPENADFDNSKVLSIKESIAIATALSLDSLTIGFGTGILNITFIKIIVILVFSFILGFLALIVGIKVGNKISGRFNLSWLSGLILVSIAFIKILVH